MARATATGLELSFVPSLKQWRKRIDGKTFYLGKGDGIDDSESYGRALAKWRQIQEQGEAKAETQAKVEIAAKAIAAPIVKAKEQSEPQSITALVIDEFLQEQETKFQRGQRMISAPKGTRISSNRLLTVRYHIKSFREVVGSLTWKKDEAFAALLIKTFRNHYESALLKNKISPRYFNDLIGFSRQFVQWAYDNYKLDSLPRNMKALCSKYELQSTAKAMSVEHINTLWKIANSRERLYIALGLNLGYYSSDIATLKSEHVKGDYIIRERNKTGVPSKHKLWDVTKKLLEQEAGEGEYLLMGRKGNALNRGNLDKGCRIDAVASTFWRLVRKAGVKGFSFSNLRDTSATAVERMDRTLTDLFLAHADHRVARFYLDGDKADSTKLDGAIDKLEALFNLNLP